MGKNKKKQVKVKENNWMELLPLLLLVTLQPLTAIGKKVAVWLTDEPWFPGTEYQYDFFMYGKMVLFLILVIWSLIILIDYVIIRRESLYMPKFLGSLGIYGLLVIFSTAVSVDKALSLKGMWEQYETVWVLLGYLLIAFVTLQLIQNKKQAQILTGALSIGAGIQVLIGISQIIGKDFWNSGMGRMIISLGLDKSTNGTLNFRFADSVRNKVYMSLYNPNYAGVYIILLLPVTIAAVVQAKRKWQKIMLVLVTVGLFVCLIGSGSKTGMAVVLVLGMITAVLFLPARKKVVSVLLCVVVSLMSWIAIGESGRMYVKKSLLRTVSKVETYKFQDIHADGRQVYFRYDDHEIWLDITEKNGENVLIATDNDGRLLPTVWDEEQGCWKIKEKPFRGAIYTITSQDGIYILCINKSGADWNFAKKGMNGSYGYVTRFGKINTIEEAPAVLKGHERALSGRGYIWGRTIPLLSKHMLLGTGPDTFIEVFPQNDYVKRYNTSIAMYNEIPSKAHSMYLQSALQTGVLSVICLLVFWIWYLKDSISLYLIQKKKDWIGLACAVSVTGYLLMGLMNDSNLATAPVFWCILGLGLAVNHMQKENQTKENHHEDIRTYQ